MDKNSWNITEKIEPMLTGEELKRKMEVLPVYDKAIRNENQAVRLMELNKVYSFYLPSDMSVEIYTKLYLAMVRSLQKKQGKLAVQQRNLNGKKMRAYANGTETSFDGIIGGSDSFSIIGCSAIGKTTAISKSIALFGGENVIEMENPFCKVIPVINVQCPFDCSSRSMLLAILQKIDTALGTSYYDMAIKARSTINMMIVSVAQILLNHVAVLCIDEVQNLIKHRAGTQLVSMLTELLNESGISIVFIGTPEVEPFFESADYLSMRTLGLRYGRCEYGDYFIRFCKRLWEFQYVSDVIELEDSVIHWLYEHSAGTVAHVLFLFFTAQEISILDGREVVDLQALESAYQRMSMLHSHIQPTIQVGKKKVASKKEKRKKTAMLEVVDCTSEEKECEQTERKAVQVKKQSETINVPVNKSSVSDWSFEELAARAKKEEKDIITLLTGRVSITEVAVGGVH